MENLSWMKLHEGSPSDLLVAHGTGVGIGEMDLLRPGASSRVFHLPAFPSPQPLSDDPAHTSVICL